MGFELDQVYRTFFNPGEVTEIRVLAVPQRTHRAWDSAAFTGIVYGYFDNASDFGRAAAMMAGLDKPPKGIYFTPNPCKPELLSRAANHLVGYQSSKDQPLTGDTDISIIRWLLVDLDPERSSGISASPEELELAKELGKQVSEFMAETGFATPVKAMSGNGYHLNYRLPDLPNEPEISGRANGLIARSLAALADRFKGNGVKIDVTVANAARIWKLYGTRACKGDNTPERPHRQSLLFQGSPLTLADVPVTPREVLEKLAGMAPAEKGKGQQRPRLPPARTKSLPQDGNLGPVDVERYLAHYGVPLKGVKVEGASTFYLLENCIFDAGHADGKPAVILSPNQPYLTYACFHQSCKSRTWKDARNAISGNDSLAQFCEGYDPNWKPERKKRKLRDRSGNDAEPSESEIETRNMALVAQFITYDPETQVSRVDWEAFPTLLPEKIPPFVFFDLGPEGKRKRGSFVESRMAEYLGRYFDPIRHTDGKFYRFMGGWWQILEQDVVRNIIYRALKDLCKAGHLDAALALLKAKVNKPELSWEVYPHLVNCKNGMIDLSCDFTHYKFEQIREDAPSISEKILLPHDKDYGSRVQLPVAYDMYAKCPLWLKFLDEIFEGSRGKMGLLQLFCGYTLMPTAKFHKSLFMFGSGANGKSTIITVLEQLLGNDNVCSISLSDFSRPFAVLDLQGKLLSVASEVETREAQSTENFKRAIAGDSIMGEEKFGRRIKFHNICKFIFAMNNPPAVTDKTDGFKRRILVLNFDYRIPEEKQDRDLPERLIREEAAGIFAWMLHGAFVLQLKQGFVNLDAEIVRDTDNFMHTLNPLLDFLDEFVEFGTDNKVPSDDLYKVYRQWCEDGGLRPLGKVQFGIQLISNPKVKKKKCDCQDGALVTRRNCFVGIKAK
ncbi:MAG: hypothetical protein HZB23_03430 [Deltaproteobacteria bacterium]|nr:hypothetical protein [Deltaproteobacteria bacterium]